MVPAADHERDARVVEHVPQVHAPGVVREGAALADVRSSGSRRSHCINAGLRNASSA